MIAEIVIFLNGAWQKELPALAKVVVGRFAKWGRRPESTKAG
jgi:hypothetical protein